MADDAVSDVASPAVAAMSIAEAQRARYNDPVWKAQQELLRQAYAAESHVWRVFPATIAAVLAEELRMMIEVRFRFDSAGRSQKFIEDVLARPIPDRAS